MKKDIINQKLAIEGGDPIRTQPLPWELPGAHWIDDAEIQRITQVLKAKSPYRYYGLDLQHTTDKFEEAFRKRLNRRYALAVHSGTAAIQVALGALGIGPGDEVLLPGYMWVTCISSIVALGAIPRLVDIDETFCMDPADLDKKITKHSKVVMLVHNSGATTDIKKIRDIAKKANLYLLEDCAAAIGAKYQGKEVGTFGDIAIFSLQMNKNITAGEGGMVVCDDETLYQRSFAVHDMGYARNSEGILDTSLEGFQLWGIGARMSEITAAAKILGRTMINYCGTD